MDIQDAVNEAASDDHSGAAGDANGVPCCSECGKPLDNFQAMTKAQLLEHLDLALLRDLTRAVDMGTATHQEKAIAKALLRDNKRGGMDAVEVDEDGYTKDEHAAMERQPVRRQKPRTFDDSIKG